MGRCRGGVLPWWGAAAGPECERQSHGSGVSTATLKGKTVDFGLFSLFSVNLTLSQRKVGNNITPCNLPETTKPGHHQMLIPLTDTASQGRPSPEWM